MNLPTTLYEWPEPSIPIIVSHQAKLPEDSPAVLLLPNEAKMKPLRLPQVLNPETNILCRLLHGPSDPSISGRKQSRKTLIIVSSRNSCSPLRRLSSTCSAMKRLMPDHVQESLAKSYFHSLSKKRLIESSTCAKELPHTTFTLPPDVHTIDADLNLISKPVLQGDQS